MKPTTTTSAINPTLIAGEDSISSKCLPAASLEICVMLNHVRMGKRRLSSRMRDDVIQHMPFRRSRLQYNHLQDAGDGTGGEGEDVLRVRTHHRDAKARRTLWNRRIAYGGDEKSAFEQFFRRLERAAFIADVDRYNRRGVCCDGIFAVRS